MKTLNLYPARRRFPVAQKPQKHTFTTVLKRDICIPHLKYVRVFQISGNYVMSISPLKQKLAAAFVGAGSIMLSIHAANADEAPVKTAKTELATDDKNVAPVHTEKKTVLAATTPTEKSDKAEWKPSPLMPFEAEKEGIHIESFMRQQSQEVPVLLITASDRETLIHAANHAVKIQQSIKDTYGYDVKVWVVKSDVENVSSIKPYYKGVSFTNGQKSAARSPETAYEQRMAFGSFCEKEDKKAEATVSLTLENN